MFLVIQKSIEKSGLGCPTTPPFLFVSISILHLYCDSGIRSIGAMQLSARRVCSRTSDEEWIIMQRTSDVQVCQPTFCNPLAVNPGGLQFTNHDAAGHYLAV